MCYIAWCQGDWGPSAHWVGGVEEGRLRSLSGRELRRGDWGRRWPGWCKGLVMGEEVINWSHRIRKNKTSYEAGLAPKGVLYRSAFAQNMLYHKQSPSSMLRSIYFSCFWVCSLAGFRSVSCVFHSGARVQETPLPRNNNRNIWPEIICGHKAESLLYGPLWKDHANLCTSLTEDSPIMKLRMGFTKVSY